MNHQFQLVPWDHGSLLAYCSCGWDGKTVTPGAFEQLRRAVEDWREHRLQQITYELQP